MPRSRPRRQKNEKKYEPQNREELIKERLYGELTTPEALEEAERLAEEEAKKKGGFFGFENFYLWICDFTEKHFIKKADETYIIPEEVSPPEGEEEAKAKKKKKKAKKELPKQYREALDFLGWDLDPNVVMGAPKTAGIFGLFIGLIVSFALFMILAPSDALILLFLLFLPVFSTLGLITYAQKYPLNAANNEKLKALTYVPEIVNYIIMQMRLQPNLERAVEFASEHGQGKIAAALKEVLWKNRVGIYDSIEEGLDDLAYKWGPYSEEFKHALTMIRASVLIPDDTERELLFDNTVDEILDSTKNKMELYARSMKQPSMYLFYIAILLPLMIIIMLPVAAAFMSLPIASEPVLITLYVFLLPGITYFYSKTVLAKRPGGYTPPEIPDDHPGLPPKGTMSLMGVKLPVVATAVMVFIILIGMAWFFEQSVQIDEEVFQDLLASDPNLTQPHVYQFFVPLIIAMPLAVYLYGKSVHKRKAQMEIENMERDFKDVLYLLASRLGEKKPLEDSIRYVKRFMPDSKVATEVLENVLRNIMVLGLTLKTAVFDPTYGALKNVPSRLMNSAFKILTDSIELGPQVASVSLISVSNQVRNIQKINDMMKKSLGDITSMMGSMATFIGPVVLGIVASLQSIITGILEPLASSTGTAEAAEIGGTAAGGVLGGGSGGLISASAIESMASPEMFQIIVGIYIIELVFILSYFAAKIRHGDNRTAIMLSISKSLPVAILVFVGSLFAGGSMIGGLLG